MSERDEAIRGEVITVLDEDGQAHDFTLVDVVEVEARRYAVLQPVARPGDEADDEAAVLFRVEDDTLVAIEDEAEFDRVVDALQEEEEQAEVSAEDDLAD